MGLFGPPKIDELVEKNDIKGLIKALKNKDFLIRKEAAKALFKTGDSSAIEPFIESLQDTDPDVTRIATEFLGTYGDRRAQDALIRSLNDEDETTRRNAAWALGNVGDEDSYRPLQELLMLKTNDDLLIIAANSLARLENYRLLIGSLKNEYPRNMIIDVLVEVGEPSVDPCIKALDDANGDIRASVATALGRIGNARAAERINIVLQHETLPAAKQAMEKALQNLKQ